MSPANGKVQPKKIATRIDQFTFRLENLELFLEQQSDSLKVTIKFSNSLSRIKTLNDEKKIKLIDSMKP